LTITGQVAVNPSDHSDPVYPVNVTTTRNTHYHYWRFPDNMIAMTFYDCMHLCYSLAKNLKMGQLNSRRFLGGISNSRKFPVFPGVADTLIITVY